jgi:putative tricarboxylic transport membrane protein
MEILEGLKLLLNVDVFIFIILGTLVGLALGALPGLDVTTSVALLLPVTYVLSPLQALLFFTSIYCSGVFAGSITAILFRIPGSSEAVMTALEGPHFTARGEAGIALGISMVCSAIGGLVASVALFTLTPFLASVALKFGPGEYFALGVLGLSCVAAVATKNQLKGLSAVLIGLLLSTVGIDQTTGVPRFDFGVTTLFGGVPFVPAIIGLFAASEVYRRIAKRETTLVSAGEDGQGRLRVRFPRIVELIRLRWTIFRSALIGLGIGILPGAGATTAAIVGYSTEVRLSKEPHEFGKGKVEGIAAPETANNAAAVGAMIPLLSLGIPGSGTTAVLMGAFLIHNLRAGPLFFLDHADIAYALFGGIALTNFAVLLFGAVFIRLFARLVYLPYPILATSILSVCLIGALAFGDINSVAIMLAFAVLGLLLEATNYPLAPVVIGLVLGQIVEVSLRRALLMTDFDFWAVFSRPLTATFLLLALAFLVLPSLGWLWGKVRS